MRKLDPRRMVVVVGVVLAAGGLAGTMAAWPGDGAASGRGTGSDRLLSALAGRAGGTGGLAGLQDRLRRSPEDWRGWAQLGTAYVDRARVTGDASLYPKAEGSFERSLELRADGNYPAVVGSAQLAAARHDFAEAVRMGEQARLMNPDDATAYGVVGDGLVELGRYPEAFEMFQRMVDLRPGLASYARVSYARELQGDVDAAVAAMEDARRVAVRPQDAAFAEHQLAELAWNSGRADAAVGHYRRAAGLDPSFVPPQAGLARAAFFAGDVEGAVSGYEAVIARLPSPQYVAELAAVFVAMGQPRRATEQFELLEAQERLLAANGVNTDLEFSLFSADHAVDPERGLAAARTAWDRQKSVFAADALAWQLHANGRHAEALGLADEALRLGTRNALFHFHRAMIRHALGDRDGARSDLGAALAINPRFSVLHAGPAAALQASL